MYIHPHISIKTKFKYKVLRHLYLPLNRLGISWKRIGEYAGRESILEEFGELYWSKTPETTNAPLKIFFFTIAGGNTTNVIFEALMAFILKKRGHQITMVLCDQSLSACQMVGSTEASYAKRCCANCYTFGYNLFYRFGLEVLPLSQVQDSNSFEVPSKLDFVPQIEASLLRYYKTGEVPKTPEAVSLRERFQQSAEKIARVAVNIGHVYKPDRVVLYHGLYSSWAPANEVFNYLNIPVVFHDRGVKKDTHRFNWGVPEHLWSIEDIWPDIKDKPLSQGEENQINSYMQSRKLHTMDIHAYNKYQETDQETTLNQLNLSKDKPVISLFTNVLWDAASVRRSVVFSDPFEWIYKTIDWFAQHPEKQLLVKIHPSEKVIGTNQSIQEIIDGYFDVLPENIRIIKAEDQINTWSIINVSDLGIVHTSTVGLEMAYAGKPCLVVSNIHYREKGFTIDVSDQEEYFNRLQYIDKNSLNYNTTQSLAKRYAYWLFERYQKPVPFFYKPDNQVARAFQFRDLFQVYKHPTVQSFIKSLENKLPFTT